MTVQPVPHTQPQKVKNDNNGINWNFGYDDDTKMPLKYFISIVET